MAKHAMHNPSSSDIWLGCSLHYHFKKWILESAKPVLVWDSSGEAAKRGTMQHRVMEDALGNHLKGMNVDKSVAKAIKTSKQKLRKDEVLACRIALMAMVDLITPDMEVLIEQKVPLSHEPESTGTIDVAGVVPNNHVLIMDYKFGQKAVSPNAPQLKLYAVNMIRFLESRGYEFDDDFVVKCAVVQPALHKEALVRRFTVGELTKFQHYVEGVVYAQTDGHDRRGAGSISTCDNFCPVKEICFHRHNLTVSMLSSLKMESELPAHIIEEIVVSRTAFKKVIDECAALVVASPKQFPNWTRIEVSNGRKWNDLIEVSEIESQLIDAGAEEVHALLTPAQVKSQNIDLDDLVDELTLGQGHHVRLKAGAPKVAPEPKPAKQGRKASSKKSAKKKSAKKAAPNKKKKSAKKKAAKKKARKTR